MYSIDKHHGKHMLDAYCEGGDKLKKGCRSTRTRHPKFWQSNFQALITGTHTLRKWYCLRRANTCASAAFRALVRIDWITLALGDCSYRTLIDTCTACYAVFANYISHNVPVFYLLKLILVFTYHDAKIIKHLSYTYFWVYIFVLINYSTAFWYLIKMICNDVHGFMGHNFNDNRWGHKHCLTQTGHDNTDKRRR